MIVIRCERFPADKAAETIQNSLIVTEAQATAFGKRYIDDPDKGGYYITRRFSFQGPYKASGVLPGNFVDFDSGKLAITDQIKIKSVRITGDNQGARWVQIEADSYFEEGN